MRLRRLTVVRLKNEPARPACLLENGIEIDLASGMDCFFRARRYRHRGAMGL